MCCASNFEASYLPAGKVPLIHQKVAECARPSIYWCREERARTATRILRRSSRTSSCAAMRSLAAALCCARSDDSFVSSCLSRPLITAICRCKKGVGNPTYKRKASSSLGLLGVLPLRGVTCIVHLTQVHPVQGRSVQAAARPSFGSKIRAHRLDVLCDGCLRAVHLCGCIRVLLAAGLQRQVQRVPLPLSHLHREHVCLRFSAPIGCIMPEAADEGSKGGTGVGSRTDFIL